MAICGNTLAADCVSQAPGRLATYCGTVLIAKSGSKAPSPQFLKIRIVEDDYDLRAR